MTAFIVIGYVLVALAILYFALKVYVSYDTEGGAIGQIPVLDGAIVPPTMTLFGLALVLYPPRGGTQPPLSSLLDWLLIGLLWIGSMFFAALVIVWAGKIGEKRHRKRSH